MMNSVTGAAERALGSAARSNGDEAPRRVDSVRVSRPSTPLERKPESAVVEISSEGARRAEEQREARPPSSVPRAASASAEVQTSGVAVDQGSLTLSPQSAPETQSQAADALAPVVQQGDASTVAVQEDPLSTVKQFDDADTNQDYTVSVLEQRAYDFLHPTLKSLAEAEQEGNQPAQVSRAVDAELKAYAEIAKAGRSL